MNENEKTKIDRTKSEVNVDLRAIKQAAETWGKTKSPRLKQLAKFINKNIPDVEAEIEEGYCNTDRHPKGVRWRIPGKGRYGNKLIVKKEGKIIFEHNAAETYRQNYEACRWICQQLAL